MKAYSAVEKKKTRTAEFNQPTRNKHFLAGKKIDRNESCPCGSGKKYKKCCGRNL
ncbi:MAG: SEC-C metal-binding domain-containing protein [Syntrophomonas sp.]|uniref:SEC-C metal-binding domain-containing protein n=1 Tax=Syntrophomonas sp. TaxID=2053627 RepID=UPI0026233229|nr:SEC-C metal-binding domain-containing protein [Syntrophomonas sp.]MDD2510639.1 SEC-C metal-binding domain-containing protein [Syntrophomonas sp.]MDD4626401.1 SEC-C metal-binding domain-containing protein [Syntrophomonas sp.]